MEPGTSESLVWNSAHYTTETVVTSSDPILMVKRFCVESDCRSPSHEEGEFVTSCASLPAGLAGQVNIDTNGDRIADYSLLDMDPVTNTFHVSTGFILCCGLDVHLLQTKAPSILAGYAHMCWCVLVCPTEMCGLGWEL
jgi:hypothetical protein